MVRIEKKDKIKIAALVVSGLALLQFSNTLDDAANRSSGIYDQRDRMALRALAEALGEEGDCKWSPPQRVADNGSPLFSTMVAGYPGTGKRLTWLMIEALTNKVVGDDFDLSLHGNHVVALKTSYPHPESMWSWGDKMDQTVLTLRNPRWAIQSYLTLKDEIDYSTSWAQSFARRPFVYTNRPAVSVWESWRDSNFDLEIVRWGEIIDFYMNNGINQTTLEQDEHCGGDDLPDCSPKEIIVFEKLYDTATGADEMRKLATIMDGENVEMVNASIWDCVYNLTYYHPISRYNNDREGETMESRFFTKPQLEAIVNEMQRVYDKYTVAPWNADPVAIALTTQILDYITDVNTEIAGMP